MNKLSYFLLPILTLLGPAAVAPLNAADLSSATVMVPAAQPLQSTAAPAVSAQRTSHLQPLPDWMEPQKPIQSQAGACSARTRCYAPPFAVVSCSGVFDCYTSNGCYVYCDGYEYDCPPYYVCP